MSGKPYVRVIEEPCSREGRFRYDSEGRFAEILGVNSTEDKKSYPTIQIMNHKGPGFVIVSCVTKDEPHMSHPHNIAGKASGLSKGICYFKIRAGQSVIPFPNIGIQRVKKKDMVASLTARERLALDPFKTGYNQLEHAEKVDLTCVRLCFQVFLKGQGNSNVPLKPVVSAPIYDNKKKLRILWRSHYSAPVSSSIVICLLCDKVSKEDIQVIFFSKETEWEAFADFSYPKCYKQHALVFKNPRSAVQDIRHPVQVFFQLKRPSDGETSTAVPFQFIPEEYASEDGFRAKRQKCRESPRDLVTRCLQEMPQQRVNPNVNAYDFPITIAEQIEPWELPPRSMYTPNIVEDELMLSFSSYNQMNEYSQPKPLMNNAMAADYNYVPYNGTPTMQMYHQMTQNSMMNNASMQQMMNPMYNQLNYADQQYPKNANEQRNQQNGSYLDELLTTMDSNLMV